MGQRPYWEDAQKLLEWGVGLWIGVAIGIRSEISNFVFSSEEVSYYAAA